MTGTATPSIPVSWGELLDKITILEIKLARIRDDGAHAHVAMEYALLLGIAADAMGRRDIASLVQQLRAVNQELWDIEDAIREQEGAALFGDEFVRLARSVYKKNDRRAAIKRAINLCLHSELVEEKSYGGQQAIIQRLAII
ncbi:MAG: hypothetical protein JWN69_1501 [Alphaproteobacteria bacterium]|nr:hypothetical protein [Alphaproteobacteria bacterium]